MACLVAQTPGNVRQAGWSAARTVDAWIAALLKCWNGRSWSGAGLRAAAAALPVDAEGSALVLTSIQGVPLPVLMRCFEATGEDRGTWP